MDAYNGQNHQIGCRRVVRAYSCTKRDYNKKNKEYIDRNIPYIEISNYSIHPIYRQDAVAIFRKSKDDSLAWSINVLTFL